MSAIASLRRRGTGQVPSVASVLARRACGREPLSWPPPPGEKSMGTGRVAAAHLVEANVLGLLTEALTAQVEVVLPDETGLVLADTAVNSPSLALPSSARARLCFRNRFPCDPSAWRSSSRTGGGRIFHRAGRREGKAREGGDWHRDRTSCESPCRSAAGASSRRFRET